MRIPRFLSAMGVCGEMLCADVDGDVEEEKSGVFHDMM